MRNKLSDVLTTIGEEYKEAILDGSIVYLEVDKCADSYSIKTTGQRINGSD
jgi:hypothetical protein